MGGFAFVLRYLTPWQALFCALAALLFNLAVLHRLTKNALLRPREVDRGFSLGIALYPAVVLLLIVGFRDRLELAAAAWALLAFGDGLATLAGVGLGGPPLPWNPRKTWSGLVAFVIAGTVGAALLIAWTQAPLLGAAGEQRAMEGVGEWLGLSFVESGSSGLTLALPYLIVSCAVVTLVTALVESIESGIDDNILVPLVGGAGLWLATLVEPQRLIDSGPALAADFAWGAAVNAALAFAALAVGGVSRSGAIWGFLLGTTLWGFAGWPGFAMLLVFFVLGTATTRAGYARKAALGIAQERGGRRGARNALANTSTGVLFAFVAAATAHASLALPALAAAFATAAADTVSSEIGQAYGRRHFLITTFRRVAPGTDGAVSVEGTLAGAAGALIVALAAFGVGLVGSLGIAVVTLAGVVGSTFESYLGAWLDDRGGVDNEVVNFTNTMVGALTAVALTALLS